VVNDGAVLEEGCIVASGAVVPPGMRVKKRTLVAGVPAVEKGIVDDTMDTFLWIGTRAYQSLPHRYQENSTEITLKEARDLYQENPEPE
jgi:carbonic anhydrase/acetyltransferase-like protein (isoleucine patch superfamily)